jgi:hypothetical protein
MQVAAIPMKRARVTRVRCFVLTSFVVGLAACSGSNKRLSKTDIQLASGDLRTSASSTQMLIEQCSAHRATETFCRRQAEMLSSRVSHTRDGLKGEGGQAESERQRLLELSGQLTDIVGRAQQVSSVQADAENAGHIATLSKTVEEALRK